MRLFEFFFSKKILYLGPSKKVKIGLANFFNFVKISSKNLPLKMEHSVSVVAYCADTVSA